MEGSYFAISAAAATALPKGQQKVSVCPQGLQSHTGGTGADAGAFIICPVSNQKCSTGRSLSCVQVCTKQCRVEIQLI